MASNIPKPFLQLAGMSILARTLQCFDYPEMVAEIIVAISPDWKHEVDCAAVEARLQVPVKLVHGGIERMNSIANALDAVSPDVEFVAVHDAVRPFVSRKLLDRLVVGCSEYGACIPGLPVTETIKQVNSQGVVLSTPDRSFLHNIQTPQVFRRALLVNAYRYALTNNLFGTDDAGIVEQYGAEVRLIEGEPQNIKLTYPSDLARAELFISKSGL